MILDQPMVRKERGSRPHASKLRRGHLSPADLRKASQQLEEAAGELTQLAEQMDAAGVKRVQIDGAKKFENGMELVWGYVGAVRTGLVKLRYG